MPRYLAAAALAAAALPCAAPARAQSSFVYSCSNYGFVYSGTSAAIHATCLTGQDQPNDTTMILTGIVNVNGVLTNLHSSVPSNFQLKCGSIEIYAEGPYVTLSALCQNNAKQGRQTSVELDNINNDNGVLVQGH